MTKKNRVIEIILIFAVLWMKGFLVNRLDFPWDSSLTIVISYALDVLFVLFFVVRCDREPLSVIGIKAISIWDILGGFILGIILYLVQIIPPVMFMHMDISSFTDSPAWLPLLSSFLFLIVTVGVGEEVVFRGFFLHKIEQVVPYKSVAVLFNCVLFYLLHVAKDFVFDWTHVYSTFATTIVLCIYFYATKKKSILPLIIAHAILDTLLGAPGFFFLNLFIR